MKRGWALAAGVATSTAIFAGLSIEIVPSGVVAQSTRVVPLALTGDVVVQPWKRYADWPQRDESKFNTLAKLASPPAPAEPRKVATPIAGDPEIGQKLVADRTRGGSCLACHVMGP